MTYPFKKSKYYAVKTVVDGITFHSKKEAKRYQELRLLEQAGVIANLELQETFALEVSGVLVCKYRADFSYVENDAKVVEDVKGFKTPEYKMKRLLMWAIHGIEILET